MNTFRFVTVTLSLATLATAQITIRGEVDDVQGTQNQFFLEGTTIPVVSNTLNLNLWENVDAILDVVNIGTPSAPILRVDGATATTQVMDMGNLRLGETKTWEVFAPAGSSAFILVDFTPNTGFLPIPGFGGAWMLGMQPYLLAGGIAPFGVFKTTFFTPNDPSLVGLMVSSQALVGTGGVWEFSNVDGKTVEN